MREEVKAWLRLAGDDLKLAEIAYKEGIYHLACFHAQQCVEKSMKALFYFRDEVPPKTHSIAKLVNMLQGYHPFSDTEPLLKFDLYYIPTRYPDTLPGAFPEGLPSKEDAEEAINSAREVFHSVLDYIKSGK